MRLTELTEKCLTDGLTEQLLFGGLEYAGQTADLILVLGSRKACEYRVPLAAELFHAGKAGRLLFCGGRVQKTRYGELPEYESMLRAADECGLPRGCILTERESMTTEENMILSREIISREMPLCKRIILVTTAYHTRRALLLARKIMPAYEFFPAPAHRGSTTRENWRLTEKGRRTAREECMKLRYYAEKGLIDDMEVGL